MHEISVKSGSRNELIDVTSGLQALVSNEKVKEGICVVYCPHTTAGVFVNENADPSVKSDILRQLEKIAPANAGYSHAEGNADSHIKGALVGNNQTLLVSDGRLQLGTWGGVFFAEFDGPRNRKLLVQLIEK
ncbi:MAG: YjbQ family protein [Candidatus Diapherotrites archaeon]|nr:YjbQ family protein [Candidatus Diapherotrites archaeon]